MNFQRSSILFLLLQLILVDPISNLITSGIWARDLFGPDEIHRFIDESFVNYYRQNDSKFLSRLEQRCRRRQNLDYYACYNLAVFYFNNSNQPKAKELLQLTLEQRPDFYDAVNLWLNRFSAAEIKIDNPRFMALHYFELAKLKAQKAKNSPGSMKSSLEREAIAEAQKAIKTGYALKSKFYNDAAFSELRHSTSFVQIVEQIQLPNQKHTQTLYRVLQNENPFSEVADIFYTFEEHKSKKDKSQLLYDYFEAIQFSSKGNITTAISLLQGFYEKLKTKINSSQLNRNLGKYFVVYLVQSPYFTQLKKEKKYRNWIEKIADAEGIENDWIKNQW